MAITTGAIKSTTGFRDGNQPIITVRPVYDSTGSLQRVVVDCEALMNDGSFEQVSMDLLPLLTAAQKTALTNLLSAIASRVLTQLQ